MKKTERVSYQEIGDFILILNFFGTKETSDKKIAKDFHSTFLDLIERLVKFNGFDDLSYLIKPLRDRCNNESEVFSFIRAFEYKEADFQHFIERIKEIAQTIVKDKEFLKDERLQICHSF